jgi:protein SCO1/2
MNNLKFIIAILLLSIPIVSLAHEPLKDESIYNLDTLWTNQDGEQAKLSELRGAPTVIAMVYTSCQGACPMTMVDLSHIQKALPESDRKKVRFAVFSFDSARDTPPVLKKFAQAHNIELDHWSFFHGSPSSVRKLAAVLGIRYKMDKNGDFDHSNVITLVDPHGVIKSQQVGLRQDPKELIANIKNMIEASP